MTVIWRMVRALCAGDGEERQWLAVIDYLVAENRILQQQLVARDLTDAFDGPLIGVKYLIHDRDTKYTTSFDHIIASAGIEPVKLHARSPDLNAYAERWVLSARSAALDQLVLLNGRQVRRVLREYLAHYHAERAHQGLDGQLISPDPAGNSENTGEVIRRKRLGGLLSYYHRPAA